MIQTRHTLRCDRCSSTLQLADPTVMADLIDRATEKGWAVAAEDEGAFDVCPTCVEEVKASG